MNGEVFEVGEVSDGWRNLAGDVGGKKVELVNPVGLAVAFDDVPVAAVGGGIP